MDSNYRLLISKINEFKQQFYLNKLLHGLIYTLALLFALYLILFILVYFLHPAPLIKTILFFSYLLILLVSTAIGIIKPALAYFRLSKTLSMEEAAELIGNHFQPVRDKLLNTLQLKALADLSPVHNQLILAGIDQKINELTPVPFSKAINLGDNKKLIKYFLVPLALIILIGLLAPAVLREGTKSFVQYDQVILPPAPFDFVLLNKTLAVTQGDDLQLNLKIDGDQLPQEVYMKDGLNTFKFEKKTSSLFQYTLKNLQQTQVIQFNAGGFDSRSYTLIVKPRPAVLTMEASLNYPAYLKKKNELIANAGDLILPEGTTVTWKISTENTKQLLFALGTHTQELPVVNNSAIFKALVKKNQDYRVIPKNEFSLHKDSIMHKIEVIADLSPTIEVKETPDSISRKALYFTGNIHDDHGFSALKFIYTLKENGVAKKTVQTGIPVKSDQLENAFFYFWNLKKITIKPGQVLEYYLEVADNDAVNGPKKSRTPIKIYAEPTPAQLEKQMNTASTKLKQQMESAIKLAGQVEKESKKLGETLLDKKELSFEDKKEINQLLDKQKKLEEVVKDIQEAKKKNTFNAQENDALKQDLAEKQKKIDDLFNNVLDAKTKDLLEKLQNMITQNNKDQTQQELSKMTMDNKSLKNELDRILELYKQLEFEQNLQNKIDRLTELAKTQKELSKSTVDKKTTLESLKKNQEKQQEDFNTLQKEMKELDAKNQALERPNSFKPQEKKQQEIQKQQQQSLDKLAQNQRQKASEQQQKAADQMQEIAQQLKDEQQSATEMESNLQTEELRLLLQHLLKTSFDQEKVMLSLKKMAFNDPAYIQNVQLQRGIKDNLKTISDSLSSLSRRVPQIQTAVNDEMQQINFNLDKSLENLADRRTYEAVKNQQYTMTSINNLSLMLNEALEQLEKNKRNAKSGGKGKGKQSMQTLQQMQQQLNKNMEQARQQLQKEGKQGNVPKGEMSENFAKMAQQQQMIREALQKLNTEENKDGKGKPGNLNQVIKDMKSTETELINKRLEEATIKRQQEVLTKLLEADKATREQNEDGKRESKAGKDFPPSYPKLLEQFKKKQTSEQELFQKLPPSLNYYYKNKIADYFKLLNLQP
ncbi:hypothetical protein HDF26_004113 [Pedobacter cryoconitis]|uniref:DUF4175 family protein n=1 Tax=Pedobacter cryoconitis TaxID=188932 RepID=UPI00161353C9|nr:DUF4175 family protein [Pedobacter cryoconitis]MBB6273653.1 hypothetical protein [Pedobacter cryoconitis]